MAWCGQKFEAALVDGKSFHVSSCIQVHPNIFFCMYFDIYLVECGCYILAVVNKEIFIPANGVTLGIV